MDLVCRGKPLPSMTLSLADYRSLVSLRHHRCSGRLQRPPNSEDIFHHTINDVPVVSQRQASLSSGVLSVAWLPQLPEKFKLGSTEDVSSVVEQYRNIFPGQTLFEYADVTASMNNGPLVDLCRRNLDIKRATHVKLNQWSISTLTSLRTQRPMNRPSMTFQLCFRGKSF